MHRIALRISWYVNALLGTESPHSWLNMLSQKKKMCEGSPDQNLFISPTLFFSGNVINNVLCFRNVFVINRSVLQTRINAMGSCMPSSFISIEFVQIPNYKDKPNFIRGVPDTCTWRDVSKMHNNHPWEEYCFFFWRTRTYSHLCRIN